MRCSDPGHGVDRTGPPLAPLSVEVLGAVEGGADTCDSVAAELGLPAGEAAAALADLEAHGYLSCSLVGVHSRTLLRAPEGI